MSENKEIVLPDNDRGFLSGGGETGALIRARDWASTPLGPVEHWPQSLRTSVSICLNSRFAILVWWGSELVKLYNDAYTAILGRKHPQALGSPGEAVWPEIWHIIGPMLHGVMDSGEATRSDNLLLELERNGYPEECYFTFSYSPIHDESGGVGGIFTPVQETTEQVIGERRLRTLRDLADTARASSARTIEEVCAASVGTLAKNPYDMPFAEIHLRTEEGSHGNVSTMPGHVVFERTEWSDGPELVAIPPDREGIPRGAWPDPPVEALAMPISAAGRRVGTLVLGVSPRKRLEGDYRSFFDLVSGQLNTAVADVIAFEAQRRRAEELAELDRARTTFFSNVSHEFRTPLTLMLGPVEEILADTDGLKPEIRVLVSLIHRNGLRLQRLVNTLLDFSRIEAGRLQARYEPVDLSALTAQLASTFHSVMEKAGLELRVDCGALPAPVYVDPDMWEKVVLNLLSNAWKYTFKGAVTVGMAARDERAVLTVEDTGTGIPAHELPHIFERFHRVEGARGRTQEGTGIGLALVAELVRMHGGTIGVRSTPGEGSAFTVSIPFGAAHLEAGRIGGERAVPPPNRNAEILPDADGLMPAAGGSGGRVLVVDDNADMRAYVGRLLSDRYEVAMAGNGEEALAMVRDRAPDLVLSDVMMPGMDGFELLAALRSDPDTSGLPVILLSARAGEEAGVEGLAAGASDYLVKPFTARELLARVGAHMEMVRLRRQSAEREARLLEQANEILESITDGFLALDRDFRFTYVNAAGEELMGIRREDVVGRDHWEIFPPSLGTVVEKVYRRTMTERVAGEFENYYDPWRRWFAVKAYPTKGGGISVYFRDITERKQTERALKDSEERFRTLAETVPQLIWTTTAAGATDYLNDRWEEYTGLPVQLLYDRAWARVMHPEDLANAMLGWNQRVKTGEPLNTRNRLRHHSGEWRWHLIRGGPIRNDAGEIVKWVGTCTDVQAEVDAEQALRRSEERFRAMADSAPVLIWTTDRAGNRTWLNRPWLEFTGHTMDEELGRAWETEVHPEDRERCLSAIGKAFAERSAFRMEYRVLRHDREWRWILDHGIPMPSGNAGGGTAEFTGFIGSCIDITDRKRAEDALRESEERLRAVTDNIPNLAWMANPDGYIFWYNRRWLEYTGTTMEEMAGSGWQKVHDPEMLPFVLKLWAESLRTGEPFEMDFPLRGADGRFRWFLTQVRPVRNEAGEVVRWFGTNTNIDDKRAAEQALRESEELTRSVIEGNPDAVSVLDGNGGTLLINAQARRRRELVCGSYRPETPWFDAWRDEDRNAAAGAFALAVSGRQAEFEASFVLKTGARILWEVSLTPLGGSAGAATRLLCVVRDVTAARKAEEELRQTAKLESLGVMAGGIAHDFNNLLTGILGNASLLNESVGEEDRPLAEDIVLAAERAADLTRQMLAYSGKGRFEVTRTDLSVLVREMLRLLKPSMPKNIEIALDLADGCVLEGDPGQIQQVVMNVLLNAGEAMEGKPGRIFIRTGRRAAAPESSREHVFFEVQDTGKGMDAETQSRIFDPFFTTKFTGRGLGLAAVSGIVRGHKGTLEVNSAPGKGTTFTVAFPGAQGSASVGGLRFPKSGAGAGVVLLADDEELVLRVGEAVLRRFGFEVATARNGKEALDLFRRKRGTIDVIVLDMMMPVMSGEEALREIRAIDAVVPVIVCSGYNEVEVIRRFAAERVGPFLQKPYNASELVEKVREIIGKRSAR